MVKYFPLALLISFALVCLVHAQDQSGFISLDSGLPANTSYTDQITGLYYISDASFINTGISKSISPDFRKSIFQEPLWTVRSFPDGLRNCYYINLTAGNRYLIRGTFMYGNYDGQGQVPDFDLYLGANMWDSVKLGQPSDIIYKEIIHVSSQNYIHVCLVNTGSGTPFISALELRPLGNDIYVTQSGSLALLTRWDTGATTNQTIRYKDDVYDRIWWPISYYRWTELNTNLDIKQFNDYRLPSSVMTTAATPIIANSSLDISVTAGNDTTQCYFYMHFAEVEKLQANQSRVINISLNGNQWYGPFSPEYLSSTTIYSKNFSTGDQHVSIYKTESSTLPPILNAFEVYKVIELRQSETGQEEVTAIMDIKSLYDITKNWQGDPCAPKEYLWEGLNCSNNDSNTPRIISLNLSSSGLTGEIAPYISNLTMIKILDLSNNNLTGPIPDFLSQLPFLTVLNLERNNLTGSVSVELIERSNNGSLLLSVGENPNLCTSLSCEKKKNNIIIPVVASAVGGLFILLLIAAATILIIKRRKQQDYVLIKSRIILGLVTVSFEVNNRSEQLESKKHQFTYADILRITNNFERVLGKGGFGIVYHGYLDGSQVAVKMLSPSSVQGYKEFHTEANLLMRVHHRNLTAFVGYCDDGTNLGLIYEYMVKGDLASQLSDQNAYILSWEVRLRIALEAAQGLEYLHNGCKPPIIHRDVKSTNILLNENYQAKIADFGLSKIFATDDANATHLSTRVVGTPGYLDPEYYTTNWLTEKSDVYSFGIVLLEIVTSRPAILKLPENAHISRWVSSILAKADIKRIVDPRLQANFNINSAWKVVDLAMACVSETATTRPTMSQVVMDLKQCWK
ncbi:LRR receptor-like serine/threonine-protein kinase IOS1 [Castanea sativa]|uniref:LRR receptor-like serine/threonine-protein kinase IOS1 n=1 Tax=Castanea sativa TaxID=21020 RepID=UPI003F64CBCB